MDLALRFFVSLISPYVYCRLQPTIFLDKVSGSGKEWAYAVKNIPIPYTIELRDKGNYGFLLPPEQIIEVAYEFLDGFVGLINTCIDRNVIPSWK